MSGYDGQQQCNYGRTVHLCMGEDFYHLGSGLIAWLPVLRKKVERCSLCDSRVDLDSLVDSQQITYRNGAEGSSKIWLPGQKGLKLPRS